MKLKACSLSSAQSSYDYESAPEPPDDDEDMMEDSYGNSWEEF